MKPTEALATMTATIKTTTRRTATSKMPITATPIIGTAGTTAKTTEQQKQEHQKQHQQQPPPPKKKMTSTMSKTVNVSKAIQFDPPNLLRYINGGDIH